jgi:tRNA C32,U32 (ribose-2'-O)-methylase TrmJ
VTHAELENLYACIDSTLGLLEYIPRGNRDLETKIVKNFRHLIGRVELTDWELRMLYGICSQVKKRVKKK